MEEVSQEEKGSGERDLIWAASPGRPGAKGADKPREGGSNKEGEEREAIREVRTGG